METVSWGEVKACWNLEKETAFQPDNVRLEHDEWEKPQLVWGKETMK